MRRHLAVLLTLVLLGSTLPTVTATAQVIAPAVVISQVYGGGGNSGAPYTHDFVELFNRGDAPVDLTGMSVQYASATGAGNFGANAGQLVTLAGTLAPGQYHLIQLAGGTTGTPLPTPDTTGTINMSGTAGKVALVDGTASLGCNGGSTPCSAEQLDRIIDLVGYGSANFFEGDAAAPTLTNSTAALRADDGCTDTDQNGADFTAGTPAPRNSSSPLNPCNGGPPANADIVPSCSDVSFVEGDGGSATVTASDSDGTVVEADLIEPVEGISIDAISPATEVGGTLSAQLAVSSTLPPGGYEVGVTFANDDADPQTATCELTITVRDDICALTDEELTPISEVQGDGDTSPLLGQVVTVRGVVIGDFQDNDVEDSGDLNGFYVQSLIEDDDGDPTTSEGLFAFAPGAIDVAEGDRVFVRSEVTEFAGQTQLERPEEIRICGTAPLPEPTPIVFPLDAIEDLEATENMRVVLPQDLVISEYFNFDRFGEIVLSLPLDGLDRQYTPTAVVEPGDEANALFDEYERRRITLDDGLSAQNPDFVRHPNGEELTLDNRFRGGDLVTDATGVLDYRFGLWRVQPTEGAEYTPTNPRPAAPEDVGGTMTVASFNVLNYFLTIDAGPDVCGPNADQECRGADSQEELERQRAKILAALEVIEADVFGLIEMENTVGVEPLADLVDGLNATFGAGTYDYVDTGVVGTDAIRNGFIYRAETVELVGDPAILDGSVDERFLDDKNRPVIAQTFREEATGEEVTVAVNHLKSKGSACDDVGDPDAGDGQGNCNGVRTDAAEAMVDWLADDPTGTGTERNLVIGDLNAYDKEDPIDVVRAGPDGELGTDDDYTDLIAAFEGEFAYGYVFDGLFGYLDHALSNAALTPFVTGATSWHINADEPDVLDYDTSFKSDAQQALYEPNPFRSSDHDPVIVGLQLNRPPIVEDLALTTGRNRPVSGQIIASDPDGDELTYAFGTPSNGTVTEGADGNFVYEPRRGFSGTDSFTVTVTDEADAEATATVTITVRRSASPNPPGPPPGAGPPSGR